jgi:hypothetical protein
MLRREILVVIPGIVVAYSRPSTQATTRIRGRSSTTYAAVGHRTYREAAGRSTEPEPLGPPDPARLQWRSY